MTPSGWHRLIILEIILLILLGVIFLFTRDRQVIISENGISLETPPVTPARADGDIEAQKPLAPTPAAVVGIYLTSWSAGSDAKIDQTIDLFSGTRANAVVIDLKDFSGAVTYNTDLADVIRYNARELRIKKLNALIKKLHAHNIYVIGRITAFQDPKLALARPDLAVHSRRKMKGGGDFGKTNLWKDRKGLAWIDPDSPEAWNYIADIAREASARGVDEINFDYIRFPSDGNLQDMVFPASQGLVKPEIIKNFFAYLRQSLPNKKISADVFGLTTVAEDDMGIGQLIRTAYAYFDYVSPMVYPSHFAPGTRGFENPADHPYEVVRYAMDEAVRRLTTADEQPAKENASSPSSTLSSSTLPVVSHQLSVKLRPWLQAFNLGAVYNTQMIKAQIQAVSDAAKNSPQVLDGFLLWDPANNYSKVSLL